MSIDTFRPSSDILWGKLVKTWATGVNQFDKTKPPIPRPTTLDELRATCASLGITLDIPARTTFKHIDWHQARADALSIRLPPKELVETFEAELRNGTNYAIPQFYNDFYNAQLSITDAEERVDFQAARIGDYAVGMCV